MRNETVLSLDNRSNMSSEDQIIKQIKRYVSLSSYLGEIYDATQISKSTSIELDIIESAFKKLEKQKYFRRISEYKYLFNDLQINKVIFDNVSPMTNILKETYKDVKVELYEYSTVTATENFAKKYHFSKGDKIYIEKRKYYGDGNVKMVNYCYYLKDKFPNIEKSHDVSYYDVLGVNVNNPQYITKRHLTIEKIPSKINKIMAQDVDTLGFIAREYFYDTENNHVAYSINYLNEMYFLRFKFASKEI